MNLTVLLVPLLPLSPSPPDSWHFTTSDQAEENIPLRGDEKIRRNMKGKEARAAKEVKW
jgi:hypothetical protein